MGSSQDQIFASFEGDKWFERNKSALEHFDPTVDLPFKIMELYQLQPRKVLEIGAANGFRLAAIAERYGARVVAVECSAQAMRDGKSKFPRVMFVRGEACAVPLQELFDLIIVNFVFHWIDRTKLVRSIAEIDRLLLDGGFLIIGDFYPSNLTKVRYRHLAKQEVYTYKQDYAAAFVASGLYHQVSMMTADHLSKALRGDVAEDERIGAWLLHKSLSGHFIEGRKVFKYRTTEC